MRKNGFLGDNYTYPFVLKACGLVSALEEGRGIHGDVIKRGFCRDQFVGNGLVTMYCRCGEVQLGRQVFDGMPERDLVSWNSMVGGYVAQGWMDNAQNLFDVMPERDVFTWATMIDGYGQKLGNVGQARILFDEMPEKDLVSWNSMIGAYATVGDMFAAQTLFDEMHERNVISWSIMIDGYARHGDSKESLNLFRLMLHQGTKPDRVSIVGAIIACGQLGALDQGQWIHIYIKKNEIFSDVVVETAILDMYMKCGSLDHARAVFNNMYEKNVISWNVMIVGLGINGCGEEGLELFSQMERDRVPMDDLTFLGALTACSHAGLIREGLRIFETMRSVYGFEPKIEHYGCVVDLLGRAGRLDEAKNLIASMPLKPNAALWGSLLAACRIHQRIDLAEASVEQLVELEADDCGVYVLLSNIYAEEKMWHDVLRIRNLMGDRGMRKETGRSVIEVGGTVHEFVNGGRSHFKTEEIYSVISYLSKMLMSTI